jgi:hypothetical protein
MEYMDFYDYPTYNWEEPSYMEGWETHPVPSNMAAGKDAVHGGIIRGELMGRMVPFEILPSLPPGWQHEHRLVAISQSDRFAMGLCSCGKVFIDGFFNWHDYECKCELIHWEGIVALDTGPSSVVGLRKNGTVTAVGVWPNDRFSKWRNVTQISVGDCVVLGLRKDGTVLAYGNDAMEQEISAWTKITQVSAGDKYALGVRRDGTVACAGECPAALSSGTTAWTDIVQVSAGPYHAAGVRRDGTVVVAETDDFYDCLIDMECLNVHTWQGVKQVCAGIGVTAALLEGGRVLVARNDKEVWNGRRTVEEPGCTVVECCDAVAISMSRHHKGDDEVLALDSQGRAIRCSTGEVYPWDNWSS